MRPLPVSRRFMAALLLALACVVAVLWYATSDRARPAPESAGPAPAGTSLTFAALVDSAGLLETRFQSEMATIPVRDDSLRLELTIDYLKTLTYRYYDWAMAGGAEAPPTQTINRDYVLRAVESVLDARPEIALGWPPDTARSAMVRLYFLDRGMLLSHGVIHSSRGPGRFPSLELVRIVEELPLDRVVWGRQIEGVAFTVRDPAIFDIVSYSRGESSGGNTVTMGAIVCHYLDREGEFTRVLRHEIHRAREHPPGMSATLS